MSNEISKKNKPRPRHDYVLLRCQAREDLGTLKMPQNSAEGKEWFVEAVGPDVEDLKVGERVEASGQPKVDFWFVPGYSDLIVIKERNVQIVYDPLPDAAETGDVEE